MRRPGLVVCMGALLILLSFMLFSSFKDDNLTGAQPKVSVLKVDSGPYVSSRASLSGLSDPVETERNGHQVWCQCGNLKYNAVFHCIRFAF